MKDSVIAFDPCPHCENHDMCSKCEITFRRNGAIANPCEWISVEERLPETEGDYLVWNKEQKRIEIRFFHRLPPHYPVESHPEIREYFGNFADYKIITHWMPLPEAPKGGEE